MEGTDSYAPYTYRGKTMLIERYLLLGRHPCGEEGYDPFPSAAGYGADALNLEEIDPGAYPLFDDLDRERFNSFRYREDCWVRPLLYIPAFTAKPALKFCFRFPAAGASCG